MTVGQAIAKRIDEYIYARGITLYKLAKDAGLPIATLQNLYRGHTKSPTLAVVYKICNGLQISIFEFLNSELFSESVLELD
ncbi:MAG: helix-turn-helix transcriptional regulator [Clostridiales bacterium]|nr:helix-turn-helix transcriptional regulator [Clostridiales bacterium]